MKIAEQVPSSFIVVGVVLYPVYAIVPFADDTPHRVVTVVPGASNFRVVGTLVFYVGSMPGVFTASLELYGIGDFCFFNIPLIFAAFEKKKSET